MAAPKENQNAIGNSGGKSLNDRILAAEVRTLTLKQIKSVLEMPVVKMKHDDYELYKAILIKLAGTVLPRLNEHSGEDGGPLQVNLVNYAGNNNSVQLPAKKLSASVSSSDGQRKEKGGTGMA